MPIAFLLRIRALDALHLEAAQTALEMRRIVLLRLNRLYLSVRIGSYCRWRRREVLRLKTRKIIRKNCLRREAKRRNITCQL